jgi:hypothetical protein
VPEERQVLIALLSHVDSRVTGEGKVGGNEKNYTVNDLCGEIALAKKFRQIVSIACMRYQCEYVNCDIESAHNLIHYISKRYDTKFICRGYYFTRSSSLLDHLAISCLNVIYDSLDLVL